jgi:hypothetical protein
MSEKDAPVTLPTDGKNSLTKEIREVLDFQSITRFLLLDD